MSHSPLEETVIRPLKGAERINLREVYKFRSLLFSMVAKEIRLRFDALHLGFIWPLVRPLVIAIVVAQFKYATSAETGEGLPYLAFAHSGIVLWFFFAESIVEVSGSLQRDAGILMKVYYPRIISPLTTVCVCLFELLISLAPLVVILGYFQIVPGAALVLFPLVVAQVALLGLGCGMTLSYLSFHVRDFERVIGLILYVGIFVSPVFHDVVIVPDSVSFLVELNPMRGALMAVRACFDANAPFPWLEWGGSWLGTLLTLWLGTALFRRLQHKVVEMM